MTSTSVLVIRVSEGGLERRVRPSHPVPPSPYTCRSAAVFWKALYRRVTSRTVPYNPVSRTFADKSDDKFEGCRHRAEHGAGRVGRRSECPLRNTIARPWPTPPSDTSL